MSAVPGFLESYAARAAPRLRELLIPRLNRLRALPIELGPCAEALRDYLLRGGKRVRGALVLVGCEAAGADPAPLFDASLAAELFHAALLIQDDFMDRDELRRGGQTLHHALAAGDPHRGASVALLLANLCLAYAQELLAAAPAGPERVTRATASLAAGFAEVTTGQLLDVLAPSSAPLDEEGVLELMRLKTGSYTFELPLRLGAQLSGASPALLGALSAYARPLGKAFQIADDLLGAFGSEEQTGKPSGNDLREGKQTLMVVRALRMAAPADAALLRAQLGRPDLGRTEIDALRSALSRSGAADWARQEAARLLAEALEALAAARLPPPVEGKLAALARYSVERTG